MNTYKNNLAFENIFVVPIVMLIVSSCNSMQPEKPTQYPTETSTFTPTQTTFFTYTTTPTKTYPEWPIIYIETFDENYKVWDLGEISNDYYKGIISVIDGKYVVNLTAVKGFHYLLNENSTPFSSIDISVEVDKSIGAKNSSYGLIVRCDNNSQYYFGIYEDTQQYYFSKLIDGKWFILIKPTESLFILPQMINQLRVLADKSLFTFFINGKIVNQIVDNSIASGRAGIGITLQNAGDKILFTFDNLIIREPISN